jgi:hypothetical protein
MEHDDAFAEPTFLKVFLSFSAGILLGVVFVLPIVRGELTLGILDEPGPIGNVVLIGVLAILVVSMGLFGLYRLFWLVDK